MKGKENLKKRRVITRKSVDSLPVDSQEHFDNVSGSNDDKSDVSKCNDTAPLRVKRKSC